MYEQQIELIDETGNLFSHFLDTIAFSSEKTIASIVLLLSTVPEFFGLYAATHNAIVSLATSAISLVVVKLALNEKRFKRVPLNQFWLIYIAVLGAEIAWIVYSGEYIHVALIVFSFGGAVSSERIAHVVKLESRERGAERLLAAKNRIRLNELQENSRLRIDGKKAQFSRKYEIVQPAKEDPSIRIEIDQPENAEKAIVTESTLELARAKSRETTSKKVAQRRNEIRGLLADSPTMKNAELAKHFNVSAATIRADRKAIK